MATKIKHSQFTQYIYELTDGSTEIIYNDATVPPGAVLIVAQLVVENSTVTDLTQPTQAPAST